MSKDIFKEYQLHLTIISRTSLNENIRYTCIIDPVSRQVGLSEWLIAYAAIARGAKSAFTTLLAFIFLKSLTSYSA